MVDITEGRPLDYNNPSTSKSVSSLGHSLADNTLESKKKLTSSYKIVQGQIVDYMVDYTDRAQK